MAVQTMVVYTLPVSYSRGNFEPIVFLFLLLCSLGRWSDDWTGARSVGRTDGRSSGRTFGLSDGQTDGWTVGRLDGRTVGRTVERSDGRSDVALGGQAQVLDLCDGVRTIQILLSTGCFIVQKLLF